MYYIKEKYLLIQGTCVSFYFCSTGTFLATGESPIPRTTNSCPKFYRRDLILKMEPFFQQFFKNTIPLVMQR